MNAAALLLAVAMVAPATSAGGAPQRRVTQLAEIVLHSGVNPVAHMLPDGRDGLIVKASPHVEVAGQDRTDYMVLAAPTQDAPGEWATARFVEFAKPDPREPAPRTTVSDAPRTGEDQLSSVRFFRGRVDGAAAMLAVRTERDFASPIPAPSHVTVDVFRLEIEPDFGEEKFKRIERLRTRACYGHSDLGASAEFAIPLPKDYAGPAAAGPCAPS